MLFQVQDYHGEAIFKERKALNDKFLDIKKMFLNEKKVIAEKLKAFEKLNEKVSFAVI